jgi:hypothetical protein
MLIKNLDTLHVGVWLSTNSTLKQIIVWNTDTSAKESWDINTTECLLEQEHEERGNDEFSNLLQALTSSGGLEVIKDSELMVLATKSIIYFLEAGCLNSKETLEESIKTVQEVMYHAIGDVLYCGNNRDEIILFIHQKIPSIMQGAYWGYALSALRPPERVEDEQENEHEETETEHAEDSEEESQSPLPSTMPDLFKTAQTQASKRSSPYYGCCNRFCFGRGGRV